MNSSGWRVFTRPHRCCTSILPLVPLGLAKDVAAAENEGHKPTSASVDLADLSPIAPIRIFRPNPDMEVAFDVRSRTPLYVLQRVLVHDYRKSSENTNLQRPRRRRFYEEKSLPESFRSRNGHYHHSGYDRGHLAPAADFYHNESFLEDSYNLINIAPQNQDMNRKIWARLEDWTRSVARNHAAANEEISDNPSTTTEVFAVTGLLWLPKRQVGEKRFEYSYPGLGVPPSLLAVPTHFFKIVVVLETCQQHQRTATKIRKFACFVIPNDETTSSKELKDYLVRWTDLEAVSGLEFFPGLASEEFKATADNLASRLLPIGKGQPLLLTDGSSSSSTPQKWYLRERNALQHLCQEQMCSPPYKIRQGRQKIDHKKG